jgi:hypothetical protein
VTSVWSVPDLPSVARAPQPSREGVVAFTVVRLRPDTAQRFQQLVEMIDVLSGRGFAVWASAELTSVVCSTGADTMLGEYGPGIDTPIGMLALAELIGSAHPQT